MTADPAEEIDVNPEGVASLFPRLYRSCQNLPLNMWRESFLVSPHVTVHFRFDGIKFCILWALVEEAFALMVNVSHLKVLKWATRFLKGILQTSVIPYG